jgi:hypothetical protein
MSLSTLIPMQDTAVCRVGRGSRERGAAINHRHVAGRRAGVTQPVDPPTRQDRGGSRVGIAAYAVAGLDLPQAGVGHRVASLGRADDLSISRATCFPGHRTGADGAEEGNP